jgi:imidazoleglycerol-phosphate dehydratase
MAGPRSARVERRTAEVEVVVELDLDGEGKATADTGVPFLDHMLRQLGRHARFEALGDKAGVRRFGDATVPLDEARARVAVDLSGRPYLVWRVGVRTGPGELGGFDPRQARHFLEGLVANARCTLHVILEEGDLPHHALEACFKALARALGDACTPDPRAGTGSTKGTLA